MKLDEWKTYRTRFLVKAKKLSSALTFVDHLGRQHCGRKGDYLVESFDGVLSIAPRLIFEDIYVSMSFDEPGSTQNTTVEATANQPAPNRLDFEPLKIEAVKLSRKPAARHRVEAGSPVCQSLIHQNLGHQNLVRRDPVRSDPGARVRSRKLPQPSRDGRVSTSRLGLM
jgi:hypothetical protein